MVTLVSLRGATLAAISSRTIRSTVDELTSCWSSNVQVTSAASAVAGMVNATAAPVRHDLEVSTGQPAASMWRVPSSAVAHSISASASDLSDRSCLLMVG